ncbi:cell wall-binding repeat-containing protein [Mobiluncus curtisii]|uniref:cell wall-binding repeat-containing protein n=1 Tax=Mobiluncus curtisii TaxID=2051 RepID=UPI0014705AEB|nr:cell wall-binding repeat-containing protein [Mobiluncus curtisii]NMW46454.1 cell wall-binding repeat-containing protein [Mobiluncus curtisii]
MNRTFKIAAAGCVAALMFSGIPAWSVGHDSSSNKFAGAVTERIAGKDRVDTNMKVLKEKFPGLSKPYHAFLARADLGFDALSAKPLASKDPVMLVDTHADPKTVASRQLASFGVREVTIVGGPGAVSDRFVDGLGVKVRERIWGKDRYETNLAVARKAFPVPQTVFVTNGNGLGNGVAATAASLCQYGPVLFTDPRGYTAGQRDYIESNPNATVSTIGNAPDYPVGQHRVSRVGFAQTPEQVSALVAKQTFPSGNEKMYIARSDMLGDAVAAANISDGPVVLVSPSGFPVDGLLVAKDLGVRTVVALGGVAAVPESVLSAFRVKSGVKPVPGSGGKPGAVPNTGSGKAWSNPDREKRSMFIKDNPGWQEPTQYLPALDKGLVHGWKMLKGTVATPVHDPALDKVAESGSGSAGMLTIVPKGDPYHTPALPMLGPGLTDQWKDPLFGCQPGDIARTAVGDYVVTKVTYGRYVAGVKAVQQFAGGERNMIGVSPVWVVKVEGTLVGGSGQEQMVDASGVTALVRDGKPVE